jgi:hypothetical protein
VQKGGVFLTAFFATSLAAVTPCFAIETGQPPNLPPPPPPPLTTATPGTGSAPPPSRAARPASSAPASSSSSSSASVGTSTADSGTSDGGLHALDTRFFIAPMLGYLSEDLDLGVGLRGGKTLDNHIYIGGTFIYQVGEGGNYSTPAGNVSWSSSGFYVGPEGGYDFDLKVVVVRPYLGLGIFSWGSSVSGPGGGGGGSSTRFVIWPGGSVIWNVPNSSFFLGGDVRLVSVPGTAFGLYAMGGIHFGS